IIWSNVQAGTYSVTAKATDNDGASTISTARNIVVNTQVLPDLIVTDISWSPSNPRVGDLVRFSVTIKNIGNGPTPEGVVSGVGLAVNDSPITWASYRGVIAPGSSETITARADWIAIAGTNSVRAHVDDVNRMEESDKTNNILVSNIIVAENLPPTVSITSPSNNAEFTEGGSINLSASANDADGSVVNVEFYANSIKVGEKSSAPYTISWTNVAVGTYTISARATDNDGAVTTSDVITVIVNPAIIREPYGGAPWPIPGKVEAEDYDEGANGVSYFDRSSGNSGRAYRNDDVDIQTTSDVGGGYNVGWIETGEWLEYTVEVSKDGKYDFNFRVSSPNNSRSFRVLMNEKVLINSVSVPNTGGWQTWTTVSVKDVALQAGVQVMRIEMLGTGFNLNFVDVKPSVLPCVTRDIPLAADWVIRNDWANQNSGSVLTNTNDAMRFTQRQWGKDMAWLIETGKTVRMEAGKTYTISFDFMDDAVTKVVSLEAALVSGETWSGPILVQPAVVMPSGTSADRFTTKSVTITATQTGEFHLAIKQAWSEQVHLEVNNFIKNVSFCEGTVTQKSLAVSTVEHKSYPNPFMEEATVVVEYHEQLPMNMRVTDISGRLVYEGNHHATNELIRLGQNWPVGIYIVQASFEDKVVSFKLIKK
ncbi:MAG: carbohydrate-binding protein, partial [Cytophagaceae bacterium]